MKLLEFLAQHNVAVADESHHHVRHGWVGVDCPHCSPRSLRFRMGFELTSGRCNCWLCGRCDAVEAVSILCRVSLREAASVVKSGRSLPDRQEAHTGRLVLPEAGPLLPVHRRYLSGRGFDCDYLSRMWGIQGIGHSHRLKWRILIPIHDDRGNVVSWTTRSIAKNPELRYVSASADEEAVSHKKLLYGSHLARSAIVVTEGPLDAWAIGPGAIATCGLSFSSHQINAMLRYPVRVVCFDSDDEAQKRADKLCRALSALPGLVERIVVDSAMDAADADPEELAEIRKRFLD